MQRNVTDDFIKKQFIDLIKQKNENAISIIFETLQRTKIKDLIEYGKNEVALFEELHALAVAHNTRIEKSTEKIKVYNPSYSYSNSWELVIRDIQNILTLMQNLLLRLINRSLQIEEKLNATKHIALNFMTIRYQLDKVFMLLRDSKNLSSKSKDDSIITEINQKELMLDADLNTAVHAQNLIALEVLENHDAEVNKLVDEIKASKLEAKTIKEQSEIKIKELETKLKSQINNLQSEVTISKKLLDDALEEISQLQTKNTLLHTQNTDLQAAIKLQQEDKEINTSIKHDDLISTLNFYSPKKLFNKEISLTVSLLRKISEKKQDKYTDKEIRECIKGEGQSQLLHVFDNPTRYKNLCPSKPNMTMLVVRDLANHFRNPEVFLEFKMQRK